MRSSIECENCAVDLLQVSPIQVSAHKDPDDTDLSNPNNNFFLTEFPCHIFLKRIQVYFLTFRNA